jgi:hypothetical protein
MFFSEEKLVMIYGISDFTLAFTFDLVVVMMEKYLIRQIYQL